MSADKTIGSRHNTRKKYATVTKEDKQSFSMGKVKKT